MVELKGKVNDRMETHVMLHLVNGGSIECLVDTGFDGNFLLPRKFIEQNNLLQVGQEDFVGVEGFRFTAEMALAEISWLGDEFQIQVAISETGGAMVGTDMLIDAKLEIDYLNQTARIVKLV